MSSKGTVLFVDDERRAHAEFGGALEDRGIKVVRASYETDALGELFTPGHSLVILDLRMRTVNPYGKSKSEGTETGFMILSRLRRRYGLERLPVIVLSQHLKEITVPDWVKNDPLIKVVSKDIEPSGLVPKAQSMLMQSEMSTFAMIPPIDEHPRVAPYYAFNAMSGEAERVRFEFVQRPGSVKVNDQWKLAERWRQDLSRSNSTHHLYKVVPYSDRRGPILGLYSEGRPTAKGPYWEHIAFETAPWMQSGSIGRQYRGLGSAMVARYIRTRLHENSLTNRVEPSIIMPDPNRLHGMSVDSQFLLELGFLKQADGDFSISLSKAEHLLEDVSTTCSGNSGEEELVVVTRTESKVVRC